MGRHRLSLTWKLSLSFACATLAVFALVGSVAYYELSNQINLQEDQDIVLAARHARRLGQEMRSLDDLTQHVDRLTSVVFGNRALSIDVRRTDGSLLAAYNGDEQAEPGSPFPTPNVPIESTHRIDADAIVAWGEGTHAPTRGIVAQIALHNGEVALVSIRRNMHDRIVLLDQYRDRLKWLCLGGVLVACLLGYALVRKSLAPLRDITRSAGNVTMDQLGKHGGSRIDARDAPPELDALVTSLNAMLSRLNGGFQRLSQFTTDLAHDMRTPLSNMRGATEVALSRKRSSEEYQHLLASNLEECHRLSRMIENVLFLGRADHPHFVTRTRSLDVATELSRIADYFEGLTEDSGISLRVSGAATVRVDEELFRRAVSNLLANAVRYTPAGGQITLEAQTGHDAVTVIVSNEGTPIAPAQLERIFDRFYRGDPSRHNAPGATGAAGLGLAIVRTIMDLHHGHVYAQSDAQSTRFYLVFPNEGAATA